MKEVKITDSGSWRLDSDKKEAPNFGATFEKRLMVGKSGLAKKNAALAEGAARVDGSKTKNEEGQNHWCNGLFPGSTRCTCRAKPLLVREPGQPAIKLLVTNSLGAL